MVRRTPRPQEGRGTRVRETGRQAVLRLAAMLLQYGVVESPTSSTRSRRAARGPGTRRRRNRPAHRVVGRTGRDRSREPWPSSGSGDRRRPARSHLRRASGRAGVAFLAAGREVHQRTQTPTARGIQRPPESWPDPACARASVGAALMTSGGRRRGRGRAGRGAGAGWRAFPWPGGGTRGAWWPTVRSTGCGCRRCVQAGWRRRSSTGRSRAGSPGSGARASGRGRARGRGLGRAHAVREGGRTPARRTGRAAHVPEDQPEDPRAAPQRPGRAVVLLPRGRLPADADGARNRHALSPRRPRRHQAGEDPRPLRAEMGRGEPPSVSSCAQVCPSTGRRSGTFG